LAEEVKVTRKYQVTIPESVRSKLGVKIGDKLRVKSEDNHIIMESSKHISNPSDALWNLFGKPFDLDATKLVEESWTSSANLETQKTRAKNRRMQ
jgi:AbrB family looped-hinge helix DNA binding protein